MFSFVFAALFSGTIALAKPTFGYLTADLAVYGNFDSEKVMIAARSVLPEVRACFVRPPFGRKLFFDVDGGRIDITSVRFSVLYETENEKECVIKAMSRYDWGGSGRFEWRTTRKIKPIRRHFYGFIDGVYIGAAREPQKFADLFKERDLADIRACFAASESKENVFILLGLTAGKVAYLRVFRDDFSSIQDTRLDCLAKIVGRHTLMSSPRLR